MVPICYKFQPLRRFLRPSVTRRGNQVMNNLNQRSKSYRDWLRKHGVDEQAKNMKRHREQFAANVRKKIRTQRELFLAKQRSQGGWRTKLFEWTERVAGKAEKSERWQKIATSLQVPPKLLAYAIGESLVFYKLTSPIWIPIELFGIVKYLQWRNKNS